MTICRPRDDSDPNMIISDSSSGAPAREEDASMGDDQVPALDAGDVVMVPAENR